MLHLMKCSAKSISLTSSILFCKKSDMTILTILLVVVIAAAAVTWATGSFFMSVAIIRKKKPSDDFVPAEEKAQGDDRIGRIIRENTERLNALADAFHESVTAENVEITSEDGLALRASFFPNEGSLYAILVHGYTGSRKEMQPKASVFHSWGYSVLTPDNRAHGESEGKFIGMGWLDKDDIALWIDWIRKRDANARIVLLGVSMGGATVMMASGMNDPNVAAVIDDCGYTSVWDIFADELRSLYHMPPFPVLEMCRAMIRIRAGYDIKKASSLSELGKSTMPVLFIHGSDDHFVKTEMVRRCYEAKAEGRKELLIVEGAGHAKSDLVDPELYFSTIKNFLENVSG